MACLPQSEPLLHCQRLSGTEQLSLPVEFSVIYLGQSLTISGAVFSTSVA